MRAACAQVDCELWDNKNRLRGSGSFSQTMTIKSVAIDRRDAVLTLDIGTAQWTFSGPQYGPGKEIANLIVPVRQTFSPIIQLLPGPVDGAMPVTVHIGVIFSRYSERPNW